MDTEKIGDDTMIVPKPFEEVGEVCDVALKCASVAVKTCASGGDVGKAVGDMLKDMSEESDEFTGLLQGAGRKIDGALLRVGVIKPHPPRHEPVPPTDDDDPFRIDCDAGVLASHPDYWMCEENRRWAQQATDDELVYAIRGEAWCEFSDDQLSNMINADRAMCRAPHAWNALCSRYGEVVARKLVFERPLRDCTDWERDIPENCTCAILGVHSGKVVCAEIGEGGRLLANRRACLGAWELFVLLKNGDGSYSLRSVANDKYVQARPMPDGHLLAQGIVIDAWEKFDLEVVAGKPGVFSFRSRNTGRYVSVDEFFGNALVADRDRVESWEEFRLFRR